MKVIVLGGDGFCGWPTALHLSAQGHDIHIVDNLSRRKIDTDLEVDSLTPIAPMSTRLEAWREISGRRIAFESYDIAKEFNRLLETIKIVEPDAIVHFAEQRAAPYSMKGEREKRYTVENNVAATHNVLCGIVESGLDVHLIHLGTMGVYGYSTVGAELPEGYLRVQIPCDEDDVVEREILYPPDPGSIYHMTKTLDQLLFQFYNKNDHVRVTDLHQGVVWGTQTPETVCDERLINRFDYDGDYGTVLNRFLMQASVGYPLTVHGTGGQTRAFIHIRDTVRCIQLALENMPSAHENVRIFNQTTETHRVRDLAELVANKTGALVQFVDNPRNEAQENELRVNNEGLISLGLDPVTLEEGLMEEVQDIAKRFAFRCDMRRIPCRSAWNKEISDTAGVPVLEQPASKDAKVAYS